MQATIATAFEILIQALEVHGIEPHLGGRGHPLILTPIDEDAQKVVSGRDMAVWPEREDEAGGEGRPLSIVAVASGALQHQLLPTPIDCDLNGVACWRVIGVSSNDGRHRRRCWAGEFRRGSRSGLGACHQNLQQGEWGIEQAPETVGVAHSGPRSR